MNYIVQFQATPNEPREPVKVCRAAFIPRVGEDIELEDIGSFTVLAVIHSPKLLKFDSSEVPPLHIADDRRQTVRMLCRR